MADVQGIARTDEWLLEYFGERPTDEECDREFFRIARKCRDNMILDALRKTPRGIVEFLPERKERDGKVLVYVAPARVVSLVEPQL